MLKPVETIKILQNNSHIKSFRAGEIIFHQGTEGLIMINAYLSKLLAKGEICQLDSGND